MSWFDYRCLNLPYAAWLYLLLVCFPMFSLSYLYLAFPSLNLCPISLFGSTLSSWLLRSDWREISPIGREKMWAWIFLCGRCERIMYPGTLGTWWWNHQQLLRTMQSRSVVLSYSVYIHTYIRACMSTSIYSHTSLPLFLHLFSIAQIHCHHLQSHNISHHRHYFSSLRLLLSQGELFSCSSAVWRC